MNKYTINYYFDGNGQQTIEAKSRKEAEDKFYEGEFDFEDDKEWGENYTIKTIINI